MSADGSRLRAARPEDAPSVAALHADSWQRHYRGAFTDAFLDGEHAGFLRRVWRERLAEPRLRAHTTLAEYDGEIVGLVHTMLDESPVWGALVDNLHVRHGLKGQGLGTRLLVSAARTTLDWSSSSGLYLWVLEQNTAAQAFYAARGGTNVERAEAPAPGGDPARLNGRPACLRYAWPDPAVLFG